MKTLGRLFFISIVSVFLCVPLLIHKQQSSLGGVMKETKRVHFSRESLLNGSYQRSFESRFARSLSIFGSLVRLDNQISLWLFKQLSSNAKSRVVMGNDGHLIERSYLAAFNRQGIPKQATLEGIAEGVARLQRALEKRGKSFVLLISTNKPSFYPHVVPSWYRLPEAETQESSFGIFTRLLRERGVSFIDSARLLHDVEAREQVPIFPPTGTHWNDYAACHVVSAVAAEAGAELPGTVPQLRCKASGLRRQPTDQDVDLLNITNLLLPNALIKPSPKTEATLITSGTRSGAKPKLLMVGTSFCWPLLQIMNRYRVFSDREFLYYFQRQLVSPGNFQRAIEKDSFDVLGALNRGDVVVIEVNEAFVHRVGYGFIERALVVLGEEVPLKKRTKDAERHKRYASLN